MGEMTLQNPLINTLCEISLSRLPARTPAHSSTQNSSSYNTVYSVIYDSGQVTLEHFLLSWYHSLRLSSRLVLECNQSWCIGVPRS